MSPAIIRSVAGQTSRNTPDHEGKNLLIGESFPLCVRRVPTFTASRPKQEILS
jgi:hypothetical protein